MTVPMIFLLRLIGIFLSFRTSLYSPNLFHPAVIFWSIYLLISLSGVSGLRRYVYTSISSSCSPSIPVLLFCLVLAMPLHTFFVFLLFSFIPSFFPRSSWFPANSSVVLNFHRIGWCHQLIFYSVSFRWCWFLLLHCSSFWRLPHSSCEHKWRQSVTLSDSLRDADFVAQFFRSYLHSTFSACLFDDVNILLLHAVLL